MAISRPMLMFMQIMLFYFFITFLFFPVALYYARYRTIEDAANGYVIGSLISILLWFSFGRYMI